MQHGEKVELKTEHFFAKNLYGRTLFIPKGIILTGKIHKHDHFVLLLKGDLSILIDGKMQRIEAPYVWKSEPGIKRLMKAHEDSLLITVHSNLSNETKIKAIEDYYVCETEQEYLEFLDKEPLIPGLLECTV